MQHPTSAPPSPSRSHGHQNSSRLSVSQTPSPYLSPQASVFMPQYLGAARKRLLIPSVRRPNDGNSPKLASKSASRVARTTSGSPSHHSSPDPGATQRPLTSVGKEWIGVGCKFEILAELELEGYQIYAVEKWCVVLWFLPMPSGEPSVQGGRANTAGNGPHGVYRGSQAQGMSTNVSFLLYYLMIPKITVTVLSPVASLTHHEAQMEWEKAVQALRRDGARPKEVYSFFFSSVYFSYHLLRQSEGRS